MPEFFPSYKSAAVDSEGYLWVEEYINGLAAALERDARQETR